MARHDRQSTVSDCLARRGKCLSRVPRRTRGGNADGGRADRWVLPCDDGKVFSAYVVSVCLAAKLAANKRMAKLRIQIPTCVNKLAVIIACTKR